MCRDWSGEYMCKLGGEEDGGEENGDLHGG